MSTFNLFVNTLLWFQDNATAKDLAVFPSAEEGKQTHLQEIVSKVTPKQAILFSFREAHILSPEQCK